MLLTSWDFSGADLLQVLVWLTPAGTVDDGGKEQPAYLNFDVALLGPPAGNDMQVTSLACTYISDPSLFSIVLPNRCICPHA